MAIKWFNIRSKEVVVADTEEKIAAMWASSDHSPNITQGQDFGWRLAPEVVVEMRRIMKDVRVRESIAAQINRPIEDIGEPEILAYISAQTTVGEEAPVANEQDYSDEYYREIQSLERKRQETEETATTTATTTESLEHLERRVELEERLAAARANTAADVQQTTTTTTTEAAPAKAQVTTTTTTKK